MGPVIGAILPVAVGIAISPIPIIAAILMLLSPKARSTSVGFLVGWVLGMVVVVVVFTLLSAILPAQDSSVSHPIVAIVQLVLGVLLLLVAVKQWRSRPKTGDEAKLPKWMSAIDSMTAARAFVLGFLLAGVNPKNLIMAISAGVTVGAAALSIGSSTIVIVIFVLIAASTVLIPVVGYLVSADKLRAPLDAMRGWLAQNNAAIMSILLLVIGVAVIGKGIGQL
ncbi:GAP family protein [Rathayibacter soli]|uniref:GAP family protein n=1 Tax=Rathayibacter soli TaxID=3144168 RepID=UPI0027E53E5C|nr:GAP family protein [Glaciibacter superstes]